LKHRNIKVFLLLFLQKKKNCSFSEEKEPKRLLFPVLARRARLGG
jgi:hypothetical protein